MRTNPRGNLTALAGEHFCPERRKMHATTFAMRALKRGNTLQPACKGYSYQASGVFAGTCLPSRLSRVRAPSPAPTYEPSLCRPTTSRLRATRRRKAKQGGGFSWCKKACSAHSFTRNRTHGSDFSLISFLTEEISTAIVRYFRAHSWQLRRSCFS